MNLALWLERAGKSYPAYPAVTSGARVGLRYRELAARDARAHARLAAVPANAKLHAAELGYILSHSGARVCFVSPELESAVAAHAPDTLAHMIAIDGPQYQRLLQADAIALTSQSPDDLAWLFY